MALADTIEFDATFPTAKAATVTESLLHFHRGKPDQRPNFVQVRGWKTATKYQEGGFGRTVTAIIYIDEADADTLRATHAAWQALIGCTGTITFDQGGTETVVSNATLEEVEDLPEQVLEFGDFTLTFMEA